MPWKYPGSRWGVKCVEAELLPELVLLKYPAEHTLTRDVGDAMEVGRWSSRQSQRGEALASTLAQVMRSSDRAEHLDWYAAGRGVSTDAPRKVLAEDDYRAQAAEFVRRMGFTG